MSDYTEMVALVKRERETETKIRAMDVADIVEIVHGLEDEIDELESQLATTKEQGHGK